MHSLVGSWAPCSLVPRSPLDLCTLLVPCSSALRLLIRPSVVPYTFLDGGRLVSLPPRFRVLAVGRGYQHAAELRAAQPARGVDRGGPHPVRQGEGAVSLKFNCNCNINKKLRLKGQLQLLASASTTFKLQVQVQRRCKCNCKLRHSLRPQRAAAAANHQPQLHFAVQQCNCNCDCNRNGNCDCNFNRKLQH